MGIIRLFASFGIDLTKIPEVLSCATGIYKGIEGDKATYSAPNPGLPEFYSLIQNLADAQQVATTRVRGAAATRDMHRRYLITGMENERMYIQSLADASPLQAKALIENAGFVATTRGTHSKGILILRLGKQSGSVDCDANVGMLLGAGTPRPNQSRFFNWQYTLDGGKTFVPMPSTTTGKTTLTNLPVLTVVGVRVNINLFDGPSDWTPVTSILVVR